MPSVTLRPGLARITGNDGRILLDTSQRRYARLATKQGRITVPDRTNTSVDRSVDLGAVPSGARFALVICNLYELGGARRYSYTVNINGSYLVTASHGWAWERQDLSVSCSDKNGEAVFRQVSPTRAGIYQLWHFKILNSRLIFREQTACKAPPALKVTEHRISFFCTSNTLPNASFAPQKLPILVAPTIVGTDIRYTAYILG